MVKQVKPLERKETDKTEWKELEPITNELNLSEGEQILYEGYGKFDQFLAAIKPSGQFKISFWRGPVQVSMSSGKILITNNRIIAQGEIKLLGGRVLDASASRGPNNMILAAMSGYSKRNKVRRELPRYGYEIPIKEIDKLSYHEKLLRKDRNGISFVVKGGNHTGSVIIKPRESSQVKLEETIDKLFELLSELMKENSLLTYS